MPRKNAPMPQISRIGPPSFVACPSHNMMTLNALVTSLKSFFDKKVPPYFKNDNSLPTIVNHLIVERLFKVKKC